MLAAVAVTVLSACQIAAEVTPNPVAVDEGQNDVAATLTWRDAVPLAKIFVDLCRKPVDAPGFDLRDDCDPGSATSFEGTLRGRGVEQVDLFIGPTRQYGMSGDAPWACVPDGWPVPAGVEAHEECWVRLAWGARANTRGAASVPYRFVADSSEIPEAPWTLLPVVLAAGGLGLWQIGRRRFA